MGSKNYLVKNQIKICCLTFPIQEQPKIGSSWDFELQKVYLIAILDFVFDENNEELTKYRYDVKLTDIQTHKIFNNRLR